jgi:hypothetical protein
MSVLGLVTIIPNDTSQGQRSRTKLGQVIILTKTLFFEYFFYWINFKLNVKVAHGLPLGWLALRADRPWPSWLAPGSKIVYPKSNFEIEGMILCSTSNERPWWARYRSVRILTLWRPLMIQWRVIISKRNKMHQFTPWVNAYPNTGTWVNACPKVGRAFARYC